VVAKTQEIVHEFQGDRPVTTATGIPASGTGVATERSLSEGHPDFAATAEKARTYLNQGLGVVSVSGCVDPRRMTDNNSLPSFVLLPH
jgi:hypothetical protein